MDNFESALVLSILILIAAAVVAFAVVADNNAKTEWISQRFLSNTTAHRISSQDVCIEYVPTGDEQQIEFQTYYWSHGMCGKTPCNHMVYQNKQVFVTPYHPISYCAHSSWSISGFVVYATGYGWSFSRIVGIK